MSLSHDLIRHTFQLLSEPPVPAPGSVPLRRAVSAAYYALFHHINGAAVGLIAPHVPLETNHRIQRWFDHGEMKKVCGRFLPPTLNQPLLDLIGSTDSPDLRNVADRFIELQQERHRADYDLSYSLTWHETRRLILLAAGAMESLDRIATSAEANIFILSLPMWKNWDKER